MGGDYSMKTLIAIIHARHRSDWREKIRNTWLPQVPKEDGVDAFFFVGRGADFSDHDNVVELDCNDDYKSIPEKVKKIALWARQRGYTYMLKCDDDVVLRPNDFAKSGYFQFQYSGRANRPPQPYTVPYGFCYVLNHECMDILINSPLPTDHPEPFDDERWVAEMLWNQNIPLTDVRKYALYHCINYDRAPQDTFAYCIHLADPQAVKLQEFDKAFKKFGENAGVPSQALRNGQEFLRQRSMYEADGLTINWWDQNH
jgi:hypothetical protein